MSTGCLEHLVLNNGWGGSLLHFLVFMEWGGRHLLERGDYYIYFNSLQRLLVETQLYTTSIKHKTNFIHVLHRCLFIAHIFHFSRRGIYKREVFIRKLNLLVFIDRCLLNFLTEYLLERGIIRDRVFIKITMVY